MKRILLICGLLLLLSIAILLQRFTAQHFLSYSEAKNTQDVVQEQEDPVQTFINARLQSQIEKKEVTDLFHVDGKVNILLLGLYKRVGQTHGHCDVIQMLTLDSKTQSVTITALPRGTYSPLPSGKGTTSTDYYVSNACGLAGLEYGVKKIEKILRQKADYLVVVGFSETLGIVRTLGLPTTDTLQWLRRRHSYAIGEPHRAHNHSTFLKQLLIEYLPKEKSSLNIPLQYILYKTVQTDLTFAQAQTLVDILRGMNFSEHPDSITLAMRPAYPVQDIPYDPEHLNLSPGLDTLETIQKKLFDTIEQKKNDASFTLWAFENDLWLQVEDTDKRESLHYEFLQRYLTTVKEKEKRQNLIADYILEMENREQKEWAEKGKELFQKEIPNAL